MQGGGGRFDQRPTRTQDAFTKGAAGTARRSSAADGCSSDLVSAKHGAHVDRSSSCRAGGGRACQLLAAVPRGADDGVVGHEGGGGEGERRAGKGNKKMSCGVPFFHRVLEPNAVTFCTTRTRESTSLCFRGGAATQHSRFVDNWNQRVNVLFLTPVFQSIRRNITPSPPVVPKTSIDMSSLCRSDPKFLR